MSKDVDWNVDEIDLKVYDLSQLPDSPTCPILVKLFLQVPGLTVIPPTFFERMPMLKVLDLSNTNILSLPSSISCLSLLQDFFLRNCSALIELPTEIGMLTKLKLFDVSGTEIMYIPKEIENLTDLEVLRVSLSQYANYYIQAERVEAIIPKMIAKLKKLKELCISVTPLAEWWEKEVENIQDELCFLEDLKILKLYLPTNKVLQQFIRLERNSLPIYSYLSDFMLSIGQHAQLTSCLPHNLEKKFEEFKKCLKWINAEGDMNDIFKIMERAEALFLSRHWTIKKLSALNITKLKYCLLAECNKMETLVEANELSKNVETGIDNGEKVGLESIQYLSIHHMIKLESIWKGPIGKDSLSSLTILALHTCPMLTTIFTPGMIQNLLCLTELTVEDCPKVKSIISMESPNLNLKSGRLLPSLKRIFLLDLPELVNIFGDPIILEELHNMLVFSCREFRHLSNMRLPHIKEIKGEIAWWNTVDCDKSMWNNIFVELKKRRDLVEELVEATNSLQHFHEIILPEYKKKSTDMGEQVIPADTAMEQGGVFFLPKEAEDDESYGWSHSEAPETETETDTFSSTGEDGLSHSKQGSGNMISLGQIELFGNRVAELKNKADMNVEETMAEAARATENKALNGAEATKNAKIIYLQKWLESTINISGQSSKDVSKTVVPASRKPVHLIMEGAVAGEEVAKLITTIINVQKKTWNFRSILDQIQATLTAIIPVLNKIKDMEIFITLLKDAEDLVQESEHIKWNIYKKYTYALKLDDLNKSLWRFFQTVQLQMAMDAKEKSAVVKDAQKIFEKGSSGSWFSSVPLLKGDVIGFDDHVRVLKAMVLKDSMDDDCSVVVVSAAGGCGKTTLVTKLCHDPEIQGKFGRNIYFATISSTPNLKVIINSLLQKNLAGPQLDFPSDEDAIDQWGSFLHESKSEILLILDDVWSNSIIMDFKFKLPGYKILVTSRIIFAQYDTYELQLLNHRDATHLFRHWAFSSSRSERTDIPDDLVDKLVICCKNLPLALCLIGSSLRGKDIASWRAMLKNVSEGKSILDLEHVMLHTLARSLDELKESVVKQCYLDLGLFPEDKKIAVTALMDMWIHLYKHDEEGLDTLNTLYELSFRNLATLLPNRKHSLEITDCREEQAVVQHDMMRLLAIHLSSQEPVEHRKRLIIVAEGRDLPKWTNQFPYAVNALLLSISTGEMFEMRWNDIQAPKVEVLVLNFISEIYTLPQSIKSMERLKVVIIRNDGSYFSKLQNFPTPQYLSGLTRIRLEHVTISSINTSILELENLQKLSLSMCKIGSSFNEWTVGIPNKLPSLMEMDIDSCDDLVTFPAMLCNLVSLRKLSVTNCHELISLSEGFGNLTSLEVLRLASCSMLTALPESIRNLKKLSILDLSYCLSLCRLPMNIGELGSLRTIDVRNCTGLHELPESVEDLHQLKVVCDEEILLLWSHLKDVELKVVEEEA